ncbi:MAG TPA: adenylate/guanylate cyclase domain-containing protein [Candidatus Binatia bacterium]|nr:adenylate/guanylate cyclase domain-containing protein [Candidatus Binatia bacterium]
MAIAFLDLASFTSMTESMGDAAAAEVVSRFSELVRDVVVSHHGRLVEQIGDAFMLVFPEAGAAVSCLLGIGERAAQEDRFPALRGGIHIGPVLYREGGYVGTNVNIASRIASEARRHQLLVSAEVRRDVSLPGIDFVPLGKRALKGLSDELELFEARLRSDARGTRMTDPVCGMELTEIGVAARLSLEGRDVAFCSETCLRRYLEGRR